MGRRSEDKDSQDDPDGRPARMYTEEEIGRLALSFFQACTKQSNSDEDILPQEDSEDMRMSVFAAFAELFPESVGEDGLTGKNKRMRLHFNQIGYQIYGKEQSRRVPAVRAKPGNPGYGFRRAKWRDTVQNPDDARHCEKVLRAVGCEHQKIESIKKRIQALRETWDSIRRPSRPAGPGRPRRAVVVPTGGQSSNSKKENGVGDKKSSKAGSASPTQSDSDYTEDEKKTKQALKPTKAPYSTQHTSNTEIYRNGKRGREDDANLLDNSVLKVHRNTHRTRARNTINLGSDAAYAHNTQQIEHIQPVCGTLPPLAQQLFPPCSRHQEGENVYESLGDLGTEGMGSLELFATVAAAVWSANRIR